MPPIPRINPPTHPLTFQPNFTRLATLSLTITSCNLWRGAGSSSDTVADEHELRFQVGCWRGRTSGVSSLNKHERNIFSPNSAWHRGTHPCPSSRLNFLLYGRKKMLPIPMGRWPRPACSGSCFCVPQGTQNCYQTIPAPASSTSHIVLVATLCGRILLLLFLLDLPPQLARLPAVIHEELLKPEGKRKRQSHYKQYVGVAALVRPVVRSNRVQRLKRSDKVALIMLSKWDVSTLMPDCKGKRQSRYKQYVGVAALVRRLRVQTECKG